MHLWILTSILLTVYAADFSNDNNRFFTFSVLEEEALAKCIEEYTIYYSNYQPDREDSINLIKTVSQTIASHYVDSETSLTESYIINNLEKEFYFFKMDEKLYSNKPIPWKEIEMSVKNALTDRCSDEVILKYLNFDNEPQLIAELLDHILMVLNKHIYILVQTHYGRSLLRTYVKNTRKMIMCALSQYGRDELKLLIRVLWMRRVQRLFDARVNEYPYVRHSFVNGRIYFTISLGIYNRLGQNEIGHSFENMLDDWNARNPLVSEEELERILDIHTADRSSYHHEADIYNVYATNNMTWVERHIEEQENILWKLQFFFEQLEARNISTDAEDIYPDELPPGLMPEEIYEMLRNDSVYRDYLLRLRRIYEDPHGNSNRQNLASTSRVRELDLAAVLFTEHPKNHIVYTNVDSENLSTTTTTTTSTAAPIFSTTSEIPPDRKGKRGRIYPCHCERHFVKRSRTEFPEKCCFDESSDSGPSDKNTKTCLKQQFNYNVASSKDIVFETCSLVRENYKKEQMDYSYGYITFDEKELFDQDFSIFHEVIQQLKFS